MVLVNLNTSLTRRRRVFVCIWLLFRCLLSDHYIHLETPLSIARVLNPYMSFLSTHMPSTSAPGDGSRTVIITDALPRPEDESSDNLDQTSTVGTIRLRGGPRRIRQHVAWEEDVVDNEGSGKKSSKSASSIHDRR
jgi:hypothetical protein